MKYTIDQASILLRLQWESFNEMQLTMLDAAKMENDILLLSNTGSGKTMAFLLAILQNIDLEIKGTQACIVVPSRELALQVDSVFRKLATPFKVTLCYGGHKREIEENNLIEAPIIVIGTPGRLGDHIRRGNIKTNAIHLLILDEYDKGVELGFEEEMNFLIKSFHGVKKKILCSATDAEVLPSFLHLQNLQTLSFLSQSEDASNAALEIKQVQSPEKDKLQTLFQFLCFANNKPCIVFCNHREAVERIAKRLSVVGLKTSFYHGGMEQRERETELCMFINGTHTILVTTDLASRGLDIVGIRYIVHYHLPLNEESFTHRNGRTARMHDFGTAIFLLSADEKLPTYIQEEIEVISLKEDYPLPAKTQWTTLRVALGKKDKVNKVDLLGFFAQRGDLKKDDIGLIDVKDFYSFIAIRKSKVSDVLRLTKGEKIKNKKATIEVCRYLADSMQIIAKESD